MNYSAICKFFLIRKAIIGGLGAFLIFLIVAVASPSKLHVEMSNDNGNVGEIFWSVGTGYAAGRSTGFSLMPDGKAHSYTLDVGSTFPQSVRLDPGTSAGSIAINKVEFKNALYARELSCDDFRMLHALIKAQVENHGCALKAASDDPYFDFDIFSMESLGELYINWSTLAQGFAYSLLTWFLITIAQRSRLRAFASGCESWLINARCINLYTILTFFFISFIFLNLHVSSLNEWVKYGVGSVENRVIFGESRSIRSDEWAVTTPFIASQVANKFPTHNPSLGTASVPLALAATVPVQGVYGYLQPRFWGFYLFGFEKGLSWLSAFRVFGLLLAGFILISIVTRGDYWLSLMGASWIALSPFTQWWFVTNLPDMIIGFAGGVSSLYILINATKKNQILLAAIVLFFSGITFVSALYPAFLVPLFYLSIFLMVGLFFRDKLFKKIEPEWKIKIVGLIVAVGCVLVVVVVWLIQASEAINLIQHTVYPGRRIASGGDWSLVQIFSGLFGPILGVNIAGVFGRGSIFTADRFPVSMGNICEAAGYILLFPAAWLAMANNYRQRRKLDALALSLSIYIVLLLIWMTLGYPEWLAFATKMSMSPAKRTLIGLGLASILLVLSVYSEADRNLNNLSMKSSLTALIMLTFAFAGVFYWLNTTYQNYLRWWELFVLISLFVLWGDAFFSGNKTALVVLTILLSINGLFVNPLVQGVTSLQDAQLSAVLQEEKDNGAEQWVALPGRFVPQYLKANGASVWNGTRFASSSAEMRLIDPQEKYINIWNRYAHFVVDPLPTKNSPEFILEYTDAVLLRINLCSESLRAMGINRFAFTAKPNLQEAPCLSPIRSGPVAGIWLYKSEDREWQN